MKKKKISIKSNLKKVDALKDKDIDYSDIAPLDDSFFQRAALLHYGKIPKKTVTIRIDADVLGWLKGIGSGYQTRINTVLKEWMLFSKENE